MKQIRTASIDKLMLFRLLLLLLLAVLAMGLGYAVLSLPTQAPGLNEAVASNLENSGVSNPVTAVLLNFRGYDTLLEMGVAWRVVADDQLMTLADEGRYLLLELPTEVFVNIEPLLAALASTSMARPASVAPS